MTIAGSANLPIAPRSHKWDPIAAKARVFASCGGNVACLSRAFLWRDAGDPRTPEVWSMGFADIIGGQLHIIPKGVASCAGARGIGTFAGSSEHAAEIRARIASLYDAIRADITDWPVCSFTITADATGTAVEGPICIEGEETGDKRFFEEGAFYWEDGPWPLILDAAELDHSGASVGTINEIERREDGEIWGFGNLSESENPETQALVTRARELFAEGAVGVSITWDHSEDNTPDDMDAAWPEVTKYTKARIRSVAMVETGAFHRAKLSLVASVTAAIKAKAEWFTDPRFGNDSLNHQDSGGDERLVWQDPERPEETPQFGCPLTITDDGQIYGHAALWYRCHVGFPGTCVRPPKEPASYRGYLTGERIPGIPTGPLVFKTRHAPDHFTADAAAQHYAHTGFAPADLTVGPDAYGIWVSGALRSGTTDAELEILRASALSGDWRLVGGRHRLIGVLAVNAPGFRVARALAASGALITVGPGCDSCDEQASLEDRVASLERMVSDYVVASVKA